jgi:hypothetical protein
VSYKNDILIALGQMGQGSSKLHCGVVDGRSPPIAGAVPESEDIIILELVIIRDQLEKVSPRLRFNPCCVHVAHDSMYENCAPCIVSFGMLISHECVSNDFSWLVAGNNHGGSPSGQGRIAGEPHKHNRRSCLWFGALSGAVPQLMHRGGGARPCRALRKALSAEPAAWAREATQ